MIELDSPPLPGAALGAIMVVLKAGRVGARLRTLNDRDFRERRALR